MADCLRDFPKGDPGTCRHNFHLPKTTGFFQFRSPITRTFSRAIQNGTDKRRAHAVTPSVSRYQSRDMTLKNTGRGE